MDTLKNKKIKCINDYQLEELQNKKLFINRYDLDLKYSYELEKYWKEISFDVLKEMVLTKDEVILEKDFFNNYNKLDKIQSIIKYFKLNIDIRDYIELNDYITLEEWLKEENNDVIFYQDHIFLYGKIGA